jgi:hypothetical protein
MIELEVERPAHRFDVSTQGLVGDVQGNVSVHQVTVGADNHTKSVLRVNDHDTLKIEMLSPLPQRIPPLGMLDTRSQPPRQFLTQPRLGRP